MSFQLGGVDVTSGFPLDVTLLCVGILVGYWGLVRRYGTLFHPRPGEKAVTARQAIAFTSAVALFWLTDGWPIEAVSEYLFSVHMTQHLLQGFVIPPLLLLGTPRWMGEVLLRNPTVRRVVKRLSGPVVAGLAFNAVLLGIHAPIAIRLQLQNDVFHAFDHLLMIAAGIFMWMNIYSPVPDIVPRLKPLVQMFYLFLMTLLPTIPSAFLVFGGTPLYRAYETVPRMWGMSILDDMQVGGLVMKLGAGFYLWIIIAVKYFRWAAEEERSERSPRPTDSPTPVT